MLEGNASGKASTTRLSVSAEGESVVLLPGRVLGRVVVAVTLANASGLRCESRTPTSVLEPLLRAREHRKRLTFLPAAVRPRVSLRLWTALAIQLILASRRMALWAGSTRMTSKYLYTPSSLIQYDCQ